MAKDPSLWNGLWSADDRFLLLGGDSDYTLLEVATGRRTPLKLPSEPGSEHLYPLALSADGAVVYFSRQ